MNKNNYKSDLNAPIDPSNLTTEEFLRWKREKAQAHHNLAQELESKGRLTEALQLYLQAAAEDPSDKSLRESVCHALRYGAFSAFDPKIEQILVSCLNDSLLDHQEMAYACASLIRVNPAPLEENRLLRTLLDQAIIPDVILEERLTALRKRLLLEGSFEKAAQAIVAGLAAQCSLTQGIYSYSEEESLFLNTHQVSDALRRCYVPVPPRIDPIDITAFGLIQDEISQRVRQQYEESPYPLWTSLPQHPLSIYPKRPFKRILIAGCGTGRHALMVARNFPNTPIVAIDLSLKSLQYAAMRANQYGLTSITFLQGDLLNLPSLHQTYDLIECTGVLHHMHDPEKGLNALVNCLETGGWLHLGLYSERSRQDVIGAKKIIEAHGLKPTHAGISAARTLIKRLPEDAIEKGVSQSVDFFSYSGCRDMLFHEQEQRFTIPQLRELIKAYPLNFMWFTGLEPWLPKMESLDDWDVYEKTHPDTFRAMYQFWTQKT